MHSFSDREEALLPGSRSTPPGQIPRRYLVLCLCSLGLLISYADRSNMAVAIVAIAQEYGYTKSQQGAILSSFFFGYIMTQILGGAMADRYGGKPVLTIGALSWTAFTLLTPLASGKGLSWMVAIRVGLGLGEGIAFPSIHALMGRWIPPGERSKAVAMVTVMSYLGAVIALPVSSALVVSPWGWRGIFWLFGGLGLVWSAAWQIWGASDPKSCTWISQQEVEWILYHQKEDHSHEQTRVHRGGDDDDEDEEAGLGGRDSEDRLGTTTRILEAADGASVSYQPLDSAGVLDEPRSPLPAVHPQDDAIQGLSSQATYPPSPRPSSPHQQQPQKQNYSLTLTAKWQAFRNGVRSRAFSRQDPHGQPRDVSNSPSGHTLAGRSDDTTRPPAPWRQLLSRREIWAVILSQFCAAWGFFAMQSWLPTFYLDFYGVDVGKIGYFAAVPSIVQGVMGFIAGYLGDRAIQEWGWTPVSVRRWAQVVGSVGLGGFLLLAVNTASTAVMAMGLITVGMAFNGFTTIGATVYPHAGFIFAMANTAATIPGIVGVMVVGLLLDQHGANRWGLIWGVVCFFYCLGATSFVVLSTHRRILV